MEYKDALNFFNKDYIDRIPRDILERLVSDVILLREEKNNELANKLKSEFPNIEYDEEKNLSFSFEEFFCDLTNEERRYYEMRRSGMNDFDDMIKNLDSILYEYDKTSVALILNILDVDVLYSKSKTSIINHPVRFGGDNTFTNVYDSNVVTMLSVDSDLPQRIVFPGALPLEKGDEIAAHLDLGVDVKNVFNNSSFLDFYKSEKSFVLLEPREEEFCYNIDKLRDKEVVARYSYKERLKEK